MVKLFMFVLRYFARASASPEGIHRTRFVFVFYGSFCVDLESFLVEVSSDFIIPSTL